ncbi:MAG: TonB family protein [Nitrospinae bacterium]|nr:TonB family protein [Nitrospinota bacterium]
MISGDNDVNTPTQLAVALLLSAIAHALFFAGLIAFSLWSPKHKIIVPGYKVDLVTLTPSTPATLLPPGPPAQAVEPEQPKPVEPEKPKPSEEKPAPEPMVKSAPPPVKKAKAEPEAKNKKADAPKKIMAKNEDAPKKEKKKEESEPEPKKTKTIPPIETASIPPASRGSVSPSTATPRPAGGGLVTEGLAFPHTWYLQILERKANENWITHGIIIAGNKSDPVVRFNILKNGRVDGLELEKSSGNEALDESALAAISKASPFPQLPADYGSDHLTVHFTFTYEQRD